MYSYKYKFNLYLVKKLVKLNNKVLISKSKRINYFVFDKRYLGNARSAILKYQSVLDRVADVGRL